MLSKGVPVVPFDLTLHVAERTLLVSGPNTGGKTVLLKALGLMAAIGAIPSDSLEGYVALGELGLDGSIAPVAGVLPAAIGANAVVVSDVPPGATVLAPKGEVHVLP